MRIAVTAERPDPNGPLDPRLGRARFLMVYDTQDKSWKALDNTKNMEASGGAGVGVADLLAKHQVDLVLTGRCGPKAADALAAASIKLEDGQTGTVEAAVRRHVPDLASDTVAEGR